MRFLDDRDRRDRDLNGALVDLLEPASIFVFSPASPHQADFVVGIILT
ncbi:MAG: hypothetical protein CLLPBCKN_008370 [Chroococcidiopsis cubana SAG 39.79]|nr:hypothetical protein [Chroococcidiopsis cubana SAG 39.79]